VDEPARGRRDVAKGVHVRHHVVPEPSLIRRDYHEVDIVDVIAHLHDRLVRNRHAELFLRLRQRQPEPPPPPVSLLRGPELEHRLRCIPLGQRRRVVAV
jgi:hypothetical protein